MFRRTLLCWLALLPLLLLNLLPFAVMLLTVLRTPAPGEADGGGLHLARAVTGFATMWSSVGFGTALLNSLQVALASTVLAVAVAVPAAYGLSRYRFAYRRTYANLLLVTQVVSPMVLVLGLSQLVAWLGLSNTLGALVLIYASFQVAFAVWLLRGYFDAIPREIEEAARLDGASAIRTLWSIFIPLSLPAIAVTALVAFIACWNEFALALTILRSQRNYTLSVQIYSLVAGRYEVRWADVMAAIFAATLPVAVLFALLSRAFLRGLRLSVPA